MDQYHRWSLYRELVITYRKTEKYSGKDEMAFACALAA